MFVFTVIITLFSFVLIITGITLTFENVLGIALFAIGVLVFLMFACPCILIVYNNKKSNNFQKNFSPNNSQNQYQIFNSLRKELIKSNIESAKKYNQEHGLDFYRKESIITEKLTESVNEIFDAISNDEDFDNITLEDFDNCNKDLLFGAINLYLDAISVKAFAITLYFSLDLEVMQPSCNYDKNIDTIMNFISESIKNPEFDNFTIEDTKNYLKDKFNQNSF